MDRHWLLRNLTEVKAGNIYLNEPNRNMYIKKVKMCQIGSQNYNVRSLCVSVISIYLNFLSVL